MKKNSFLGYMCSHSQDGVIQFVQGSTMVHNPRVHDGESEINWKNEWPLTSAPLTISKSWLSRRRARDRFSLQWQLLSLSARANNLCEKLQTLALVSSICKATEKSCELETGKKSHPRVSISQGAAPYFSLVSFLLGAVKVVNRVCN